MTAADLLADLTAQGLSLAPLGDGLRVTPASRLTAAQRQVLTVHKAELLALVRARAALGPWDQALAEGLLAELRATACQLERSFPGGHFPGPLACVVGDALDIAEGYVQDHDQEAARGWDALELLRGVRPRVVEMVEWAKRHRGPGPVGPQ